MFFYIVIGGVYNKNMLFLLDYCSIFDIFVYLKYMFIRYEYRFIEVRVLNKFFNKWIIFKYVDDNLLLYGYLVFLVLYLVRILIYSWSF